MSLDFILLATILTVTPGPGVIFTLATGLSRGGKAGIVAAFGCTLGIVPHVLAAITGLAALLHASALAFEMVKYAGAAYLLWMAWAMWRDRSKLSLDAMSRQADAAPALRIIFEAVLINLLNPKLTIFFFAFLPQFIRHDRPDMHGSALAQMLLLSATFMALTFGIFVLYGLFAARLRSHVLSRPAILLWLRRSFAAAFVAMGVKLAVAER